MGLCKQQVYYETDLSCQTITDPEKNIQISTNAKRIANTKQDVKLREKGRGIKLHCSKISLPAQGETNQSIMGHYYETNQHKYLTKNFTK